MKRIIILLLGIFSLLLISQCDDNPVTTIHLRNLNNPVTLGEGEFALFAPDSFMVGFSQVIADGRCPINLECFWEGMAEVEFWYLDKTNDTLYFTAGISGGGNGEQYRAFFADYCLTIDSLKPYPIYYENIPKTPPIVRPEYKVTFTVTSADSIVTPTTPVILSNLSPASITLDPFELAGLDIVSDTLKVTVRYGGGCKQHSFWLYMSPMAFMESFPVQANLYLRHFDNYDFCDAYITDTLRFDISAIRDFYEDLYQDNADIQLNVYDYFEETPGSFQSFLYTAD